MIRPGRAASASRGSAVLAWCAVVACIAMIFAFSTDAFSSQETSGFLRTLMRWLWPDLDWRTAHSINRWIRKTAHFTEYALLALLACRAIWLSSETTLGRVALLALTLVLVTATVDETHQAFAPTRGGSPWDVALDLCGGMAAVLLFLAARRVPRSSPPRSRID